MNEKAKHLVTSPIAMSAATFAVIGGVDMLASLGPTGLVVGALGAIVAYRHGSDVAEYVRNAVVPPSPVPVVEEVLPQEEEQVYTGKRSVVDRLLGRFPEPEPIPEYEDGCVEDDEEMQEESEQDVSLQQDPFARAASQSEVPGVKRLTVSQIVAHVEPNSYRIWIGRSLTKPGNPAVPINIFKRHLKLIGASQYGKSSMAAALLEIIVRTHDPQHVMVALLDLEDQTSRLFARVPHIMQIVADGKQIALHAHDADQVLEHLGYLGQIMDYRYTFSKTDMLQQPLILAYIEEFIALKDYFKSRIDAVAKDEKEQAKRDYANLVFRIKELARRGLKARIQLLLCSQCDYRDDDLQEALINITSGLSFSVRFSAAQAAGFYQSDLLHRNAKDDKKGQAVVEMPDCKDLVLAPEYDLEQRLIALEKAESMVQRHPVVARSFAGPGIAVAMKDRDTDEVSVPAQQLVAVVVPTMPAPKRIDLTPYADAWNSGANSVRKLQDAAHIETYYKAEKIYHLLLEAKMIEVKR